MVIGFNWNNIFKLLEILVTKFHLRVKYITNLKYLSCFTWWKHIIQHVPLYVEPHCTSTMCKSPWHKCVNQCNQRRKKKIKDKMIGHPLITTTSCRMQLMLCVYWSEIYNPTSHSEFTVYIFLYIASIKKY